MMESQIHTFSYPDGSIQRVQCVRLDGWQQLTFLKMGYAEGALSCFADIYRQYLVPACPWLFGHMVLFHVPENVDVPFPEKTAKYGRLADRTAIAAAGLERGVKITRRGPVFRDDDTKSFWQALQARGCIRIVSGKLPITTMIPVGDTPGYLTREEADAAMKVNASFFIMDRFDCATVFDPIGQVIGLCVKDGVVENPPLYNREALLVRENGRVSVEHLDIRDMMIEINGKTFCSGINADIYTRPEHPYVWRNGRKLVITGCHVAAVKEGPVISVPASGFVLIPWEDITVQPGAAVTYRGLENVRFGIQVGNSIVRSGKKTDRFLSKFYNIRHLEPVAYPPSLYPMNFRKARAARIALGADAKGSPMLLWAEGAGKLRYVPGEDSRGASLADMAQICVQLGMVNAINLDGGGSAQILLKNKRSLKISDRNAGDNSEAERLVPLGLIVR